MLACRSVQAFIFQSEPLHRPAAHNVRLHYFVHISQGHASVPNRLGIDDQIGPMLALIEAS